MIKDTYHSGRSSNRFRPALKGVNYAHAISVKSALSRLVHQRVTPDPVESGYPTAAEDRASLGKNDR